MKKLTAIERQFATDNHNLIYQYLHDKDLSIEDYYGAAADGLILATMAYNRKPELHDNYAFSTIAYKYMKREINHQLEREQAAKRKSEELPLSFDELHEEAKVIHVSDLLDALLQADLLKEMDERQQDIVNLKLGGYNNEEIRDLLHMPNSSFYKELGKIRNIVAIVIEA